jgi:hypothetical protein
MRKLMLTFVVVAMCAVASGCSTKSVYIDAPGSENVDPAAQFNVGNISDTSGFKFAADDQNAFNLADAMKASLQSALSMHVPQNAAKQYSINVEILQYDPGNAFLRWLAPTAGTTTLSVKAEVSDGDGKSYATIPVSRSIGFGGAFTIGAWKYVFDDVAKEIVSIVTNTKKRKPATLKNS